MNDLLTTSFHIGHHAFTALDLVEVVGVVFLARLILALPRRALRRAERFSTLDFSVMGWHQGPWDRMAIQSRIRTAIDAQFRTHGVEIPFPQRTLHVMGDVGSLD